MNRAYAIRKARKLASQRVADKRALAAQLTIKYAPVVGPLPEAANDTVYVPEVFRELVESTQRYKVAHGGRGSAKSWTFAAMLVRDHMRIPGLRSLCVREVQKSINQSVKRLIEDVIKRQRLSRYFRILNTHIECPGGGRIDFIGLQNHTSESIKSYEGARRCWVEEAQTISAASLRTLRPTLRAKGTELWFSYNPKYADDPVDALFRGEHPPAKLTIIEANWNDNPFLEQDMLDEMREDYERDAGLADHVWGGGYLERSQASVFSRWRVEDFETPQWHDRAKFRSQVRGLDFGYSVDPTAAVHMWLDVDERTLYISHEAYEKHVELDRLADFLVQHIPEAQDVRWPFIADSARPDIISFLKARKIPVKPSKKGAGSIEQGIKFLQSFDIVVHPRCIYTQRELARYSYKVDKRTEQILDELEDKNNHCIDSIRYACEKFWKESKQIPL